MATALSPRQSRPSGLSRTFQKCWLASSQQGCLPKGRMITGTRKTIREGSGMAPCLTALGAQASSRRPFLVARECCQPCSWGLSLNWASQEVVLAQAASPGQSILVVLPHRQGSPGPAWFGHCGLRAHS